MNRVELRGGLTRDVDVKQLQGGSTLCSMTLAVNGTRYDSQQRSQVVKVIFVTCQGWGPVAAEMMSLKKGDEVYVVGELDQYRKDDSDKPSTRVTVFMLSVLREAGGGRSIPQQRDGGDDPWADDPWKP